MDQCGVTAGRGYGSFL